MVLRYLTALKPMRSPRERHSDKDQCYIILSWDLEPCSAITRGFYLYQRSPMLKEKDFILHRIKTSTDVEFILVLILLELKF